MALMTVPDPDRKRNAPAPKDFVQVDVVEGRPAVTSLQVAEAFGKRHSDVLRDIRVTMEKCSPDFSERNFALNSYPAELGGGLTKECPMYLLSKDGLMMVTMGYTTPEAMTVKEIFIVRFNEMEERLRGPLLSLPDFSNPALAARAWAEQYEQRQLAEAQRDEVIRTKAQIGSRREATSMAKASAAVRKAARLEDELGRGETYREVKAIPWLYDVFLPSKGMYSVIGKALKRLSADLGYKVKKIPSTEYPDGVNAYHVDVLASFRQELSRKPDMLARYRAPREVEA